MSVLKELGSLRCSHCTATMTDSVLVWRGWLGLISLMWMCHSGPPVFLFNITFPGLLAASAMMHCMASEVNEGEAETSAAD